MKEEIINIEENEEYEAVEITWEELQIGDIFPDGSIVQEIRDWEYRPCYKLISENNNSIIASDEHLFHCQFYKDKELKIKISTTAKYGNEILDEWSNSEDIFKAFNEGLQIILLPENIKLKSINIYDNGNLQKVRCITTNTGHYQITDFCNHNTTLLKYMGNYHLPEKRNIITIEDTAELNMPIPLALITNNHYKIKDLFKASLRQFPSHMIVGETRTDEIVDILESSLTISCLTTIHANSFERAIQRIIFMSMPRKIPSDTIKDLINASIDCFIFMEARKVKGMWEKKDDKHYENIYEAYEEVK